MAPASALGAACAPLQARSGVALQPCSRAALRRGAHTPRAGARVVALFGPSKEELALKLRLDEASRALAEANTRAGALAVSLESEQAARKKAEESRDMYVARLKEADKDVLKLERRLEEAEKAFVSYQTTAERQIEDMGTAMKAAGITL